VNPNYIPCPPGKITYQGKVLDKTGSIPLQGVVVILTSPPGFGPSQGGMATSDAHGYWSITFNYQCPANAQFYWQSSSNGPLVLTVNNIPKTSEYNLNIQRQTIYVGIAHEFANAPQTQISWTITYGYQFSIDAKVKGNINVGFIGVDAAGSVGTTISSSNQQSVQTSSDIMIYYPTGLVYYVTDVYGNSVVYVQTFSVSTINTQSFPEYLSISDALTRATQAGQYPYVNVAPKTSITKTETLTTTVTIDSQVGVNAFGVTLTVHEGVSSGTQQTITVKFDNSNNSNAVCFVIYQEGVEIHTYFYHTGNC